MLMMMDEWSPSAAGRQNRTRAWVGCSAKAAEQVFHFFFWVVLRKYVTQQGESSLDGNRKVSARVRVALYVVLLVKLFPTLPCLSHLFPPEQPSSACSRLLSVAHHLGAEMSGAATGGGLGAGLSYQKFVHVALEQTRLRTALAPHPSQVLSLPYLVSLRYPFLSCSYCSTLIPATRQYFDLPPQLQHNHMLCAPTFGHNGFVYAGVVSMPTLNQQVIIWNPTNCDLIMSLECLVLLERQRALVCSCLLEKRACCRYIYFAPSI